MRSNYTTRMVLIALCLALTAGALVNGNSRSAPRFVPDDPSPADDDTRLDASGARRRDLGRYADFVLNTFRAPGDQRPTRALNVNTLGEVPDSSWFTNRIGTHPLTMQEVVRGPDRVDRLDVRRWIVVEGKDEGRQPGFRAIDADDPTRTLYQIEFDPKSNPEMATGAEIIGTAIYHALGYNVVPTYLIDLDTTALSVAPDATMSKGGQTRRFTDRDLQRLLRSVARKSDGTYRATASPFAPGKYLGPFRYYGTRPDDPNDIYPHEHRRELRANRVFAAWLNHDDSRAGNSLDMLVSENGRTFVKHYMFDFGSILGSGTNEADHPWTGSEYLTESKPGLLTLASLGLWRRDFIAIDSPSEFPAAGNFTADRFDPVRWKPHYPNQAFRLLQPEDAFWAARLVAAFTPQMVSAIVSKAKYSDPRVTDYVTGTLLQRREVLLRAWLAAMNPVASPRVSGSNILVFQNAAEDAGIAGPASEYDATWFAYDNETGQRQTIGDPQRHRSPAIVMPVDELQHSQFAGVEVRTRHRDYPVWSDAVRFYLRKDGQRWVPVGIERAEMQATRGTRVTN